LTKLYNKLPTFC